MRNEEGGEPFTKFGGDGLQVLLDEDDAQTQKLADLLDVDQASVASSLKSMRNISKVETWLPRELGDCYKENR